MEFFPPDPPGQYRNMLQVVLHMLRYAKQNIAQAQHSPLPPFSIISE
jgi:hypothetical protein